MWNLNIFNKKEKDKRETINKLKTHPYGLQILSSQIEDILIKKMNIKNSNEIFAKFLDDGQEKSLYFLLDANKNKVLEKKFNIESKKIIKEIKKYMPEIKYVINTIEEK